MEKFEFTTEGYIKAKEYLESIGEFPTGGFSVDGWSIVETANVIFARKERERIEQNKEDKDGVD